MFEAIIDFIIEAVTGGLPWQVWVGIMLIATIVLIYFAL